MSDEVLGSEVPVDNVTPDGSTSDSSSLGDNVPVGNDELDWGWTGDVGDDMLGVIQNKGWKGVEDIVNSYTNLEKFRGADENSLLKMPSNDEERNEFYSKLGRPDKAEDYNFNAPEGYEETDLDKLFREKAFENGVSADAYTW